MSKQPCVKGVRRTASEVISTLEEIADEWYLAGKDVEAGALDDALDELEERIGSGLA